MSGPIAVFHRHSSLPNSLVLCPIRESIQQCRRQTLQLASGIHHQLLATQSHPDFSPVGWHLGHIAYTESLWISSHLAGLSLPSPVGIDDCKRLFSADGLPKAERQNLPKLEALLHYLALVRAQTMRCLETADPEKNGRLWHWLIQHESQHLEIMKMVLAMHRLKDSAVPIELTTGQQMFALDTSSSAMVCIEASEFVQGSDDANALDNERPAHRGWLNRYWIDRVPVTCGQYQQFIAAGGYTTAKWWSPAGWQWQQQVQVTRPLYWADDAPDNQFVCGVSWYEADAYARFVGKRLPTEAEWAKAASADAGIRRMLGGVWEWTDSWFAPYRGFQPFPYDGYSQQYFDGEHRVLRGGSYATPRWALRNSFRNWYHPYRREMFAGFRCAA